MEGRVEERRDGRPGEGKEGSAEERREGRPGRGGKGDRGEERGDRTCDGCCGMTWEDIRRGRRVPRYYSRGGRNPGGEGFGHGFGGSQAPGGEGPDGRGPEGSPGLGGEPEWEGSSGPGRGALGLGGERRAERGEHWAVRGAQSRERSGWGDNE
ncbi:hypothetical protein H6P81_017351 [Aristolochia fimbriata]|uniref:Uncharacterized protein n=1 Tax=Aristolochia fimbriata TaxID=158543 RepID=A0AAV7E0Y3_ARIFI|nr:hypothetical protein H6P81_017351 [Aristolochia fimbriata]